MKPTTKKALFVLFVCIASVLVYSCEKKKSSPSTNSSANKSIPPATFDANLNGSDPGNWTVSVDTFRSRAGYILITGSITGNGISLIISATSVGIYKMGNYSANDTNASAAIVPSANFAARTSGTLPDTGTLVITAYDPIAKSISGRFSFVGNGLTNSGINLTSTVTNGSFSNVVW